jgi:hypothetical protein
MKYGLFNGTPPGTMAYCHQGVWMKYTAQCLEPMKEHSFAAGLTIITSKKKTLQMTVHVKIEFAMLCLPRTAHVRCSHLR